MNELLSCPFCGVSPEVRIYNQEPRVYGCQCDNAECGISMIGETEAELIEHWNRRAPATWIPYDPRHPPKDGNYVILRVQDGERVSDTMPYDEQLKNYWDMNITHYLPTPLPSLPESK